MKSKHRRSYLDAIVKRIELICEGKQNPVVVDAYRLFEKACDDAGIPHHFGIGDSAEIVNLFSSQIENECKAIGIHVFKVPQILVGIVGHGRQAEITDENTPQLLANYCLARAGHPNSGFALFGCDVSHSHPIVKSAIRSESKPTLTRMENLKSRSHELIGCGLLSDEDCDFLQAGYDGSQKELSFQEG